MAADHDRPDYDRSEGPGGTPASGGSDGAGRDGAGRDAGVDPGALTAALDAHDGGAISRLGYFCAPFRPAAGPLSDRVVKAYRPQRDRGLVGRIAAAHDDYLVALRGRGVEVPPTAFVALPRGGALQPVVVQRALDPDTMLRVRILAASPDAAVTLIDRAARAIHDFWSRGPAEPRIGFHPSIRNYAVTGDRMVFFDTFPPLIGFDRAEMGRLLLAFSASPLVRLAGPLLRGRVAAIQDEWYSEAGNLIGLLGSAVRLRPDDAAAFLDLGRVIAARDLSGPARDEMLAAMAAPPRLPGYWTATRRALGLQGAPNLKP